MPLWDSDGRLTPEQEGEIADNTAHREIVDGNPHGTDAADIGLENVDNTSDADKPISDDTQDALDNKKDDFSENTAFNKNFGSTTGTVTEGDDSRLSDARTPTAHAASHTDGTDDIQSATNAQKGLATASQITDVEANTAARHGVNDANSSHYTKSETYTKTEVNGLVDESLKTPEAYDPTVTGNYPLTYDGVAVKKNDTFRITADKTGIGDGVNNVNVEDLLIALIDTPSAIVNTDWMIAESNRDQATETTKGVAELATQAETDTGTDDLRIVTPAKLKNNADFLKLKNIPVITKEPTGISVKTDVSASLTIGTRTVTIQPSGSSFDYYLSGVKYTKSAPENVVFSNTSGVHYIYYSGTTLTASTSAWDLSIHVPVTTVFWNATTGTGFLLDERHGLTMDWATHQNLHTTRGTRVTGSGFVMSGYTLNSDTLDTNITYALSSGTIADEDLETILSSLSDGNGIADNYTIFYRSGASGEWTWSREPFPFTIGTNAQYNQNTGSTWQLTDMSGLALGNYFNVYVVAVPSLDTNYQYLNIVGQNTFTTLADAQESTILDQDLTGLDLPESASLYQITLHVRTTYSTTGNVVIADVRKIIGTNITISGQIAPSIHNNLAGRDALSAHPATSISTTNGNTLQAIINTLPYFKVTQIAHGFSVKNAVYHNGTIWVKAKSDSGTTLGTHIVIASETADTFYISSSGRFTITGHGLTPGSYYFVSDATAGLLTATEPTTSGNYSNPIAYIEDANTIQVFQFRAVEVI